MFINIFTLNRELHLAAIHEVLHAVNKSLAKHRGKKIEQLLIKWERVASLLFSNSLHTFRSDWEFQFECEYDQVGI